MRQVERHWIKENHELYSVCDDLTFKAKTFTMQVCIKFDSLFLREVDVKMRINLQFFPGLN